MENLSIYNKVRAVPIEAQKSFNNGRFSGTDINPMWRIKTLTETFGPVGIGWYYEVISERSETIDEDHIIAIVDINLYVKVDKEWSKPIYGTGGNMILTLVKDKSPATTYHRQVSDEGYKMALTDAISVACKALGVGADIYWDRDRTKYTDGQVAPQSSTTTKTAPSAPHESAFKAATVYQKTTVRKLLQTDPVKLGKAQAAYGIDFEKLGFDDAVKIINKMTPKQEQEGA